MEGHGRKPFCATEEGQWNAGEVKKEKRKYLTRLESQRIVCLSQDMAPRLNDKAYNLDEVPCRSDTDALLSFRLGVAFLFLPHKGGEKPLWMLLV